MRVRAAPVFSKLASARSAFETEESHGAARKLHRQRTTDNFLVPLALRPSGKEKRDFGGKRWQTTCMAPMEPPPKNLRPELLRRISSMPEEDLVWLHDVLLNVEKERLWEDLSADMEADRRAGRLQRLPEIVREVRAELKRP